MGKSTVRTGKGAATVECGQFNCYDDDNRCRHCGAHIADPHQPGACPHADEPADECDARPADESERDVHVRVRAVDGIAAAREVLAALARHGVALHNVASVWEVREHGPAEFLGVARLG